MKKIAIIKIKKNFKKENKINKIKQTKGAEKKSPSEKEFHYESDHSYINPLERSRLFLYVFHIFQEKKTFF